MSMGLYIALMFIYFVTPNLTYNLINSIFPRPKIFKVCPVLEIGSLIPVIRVNLKCNVKTYAHNTPL